MKDLIFYNSGQNDFASGLLGQIVTLIPEENIKDLQEIPANVKEHLTITPVRWIDKVLEIALERQPMPLADDEAAVPPTAVVVAAAAPEAKRKTGRGSAVKH